MTRITQSQLESYLWGAAVLLRGTIDAGDYKQFIFPLLFYKRLCDAFDEETQIALAESDGDKEFAAFPENHRFQIPPEAHWREVRHAARDVGRVLQSALRAIETANPDKLYGIFGDAQWTNKDRLTDAMLHDLIEHFSSLELTVANLPEDELGQGYEYLIKKFADDSGHTAAEFYTNRTVVHLMTEMLQPQPVESIYDPTTGSGGMLLSCIAQLRRQGKEWRNVRLYGQERNLMTSSIARMNCFLHGIEDFRIERGDTLSEPKFVQGDRLMQFDVSLANPPYSIKQWDRAAFASDPWGRNLYGTPPQGRADYAFWQHIICSLAPKTGRCAILFPHGVLFRQEEAEMRRKIIEADLIECVLGLGPNLFYNSPMEACIVICRTDKPKERRGKILFINAVGEVTRERAQSFLTYEHVEHIVKAYNNFKDETGFAYVATLEEIRAKDSNLSIPLYVASTSSAGLALEKEEATYRIDNLSLALGAWLTSRKNLAYSLRSILPAISFSATDEALSMLETCAVFDRSTWQGVRFGDVVQNVNETERSPTGGIERFIGLEHMEPGSLHIRSWGNVEEGTTFTRRCRPRQVLFGKRRAYQRKVAVAEFDAVVSGDIYVFAPKNDRLLSELLPFLCMSERFFQHAVGTSAGSLSPRTNWSSLASFEFALPPLGQQRLIAEILWAVDQVDATLDALRKDCAAIVAAHRESIAQSTAQKVRVEDISVLVTKGESPGWQGFEYQDDGAIFVTSENVVFGSFAAEPRKHVPLEFHNKLHRSSLLPGDILFNIVGASIGRGCILPELGKEANVNQAVAVIRLDKTQAIPEYVLSYMLSPTGLRNILGTSVNTARANLSLEGIRNTLVPLDTLPDQIRLARFDNPKQSQQW
jgi:type I restriction enzyme M protein